MDQNTEKICQKLQYDDFLYATLYSTFKKIPLYSAYKFDPKCSGTSPSGWHVEPQLISLGEPDYMILEKDLKDKKDQLKKTQAISSDYELTGYDRGHLYPNSFQCGEDRKATFTLTNAAPMDACFNRIHWKLWEGYLQSFFKDSQKSVKKEATVYIVTEHQRRQMSKDAQNSFLAVQDIISSDTDMPSGKRPKIAELNAILNYDSSSDLFTSAEKLKEDFNTACVLTAAKKRRTSDKQKREVSVESVECQLVPEKSVDGKTAADGSPCNRFENNGYKCTCFTQEGKSKSCCSTPCLYQDKLKGYYCYSGKTQIQCSPQYSLITVNGKRCRDDHPCATYDKDYYWCFIDSKSWEYCSPPLWGSRAKDGKSCRSNYACAKYDKSNPWCYTDDKNWDYCCTSDDFFSAVNYKTCKPNHPCGYHGKAYLWCNTTDGSWNYCCKEFKI
ncbi:hypothetical protein QQF64_023771 [Cirrhinus molitorella]|uniref:Endonuclease domain-containing 1 protein n=1 Tax=Cirrhinus molitorella TaxID=172907 RepID=A0ABR3NJC9_9TELE